MLCEIPEENLRALDVLREGGRKLGLVSNADAMEMGAWPDSPLAQRFDAVAFSCDVGSAKPEPAIYEWCLYRLRMEAGSCLFVGDGGSNELAGARELGFETVLMSGVIRRLWPEVLPERRELADHEIEGIRELPALLRELEGDEDKDGSVWKNARTQAR